MAISISKKSTSLILRPEQKDFSEKDALECLHLSKTRDSSFSLVALDFSSIATVAPTALPILTQTSESIANDKAGLVVLASQAFSDLVASKGLGNALPCIVRQSSAELDKGLSGTESKLDLIAAVASNALRDTVQFFVGIPVTSGSSAQAPLSISASDILGSIDIAGNSIAGVMIISFPKSTYISLLSKIMGSEITVIDADTLSWVAEMSNITLGRMKSYLNDRGFGINMAIPKVITAQDFEHLKAEMTRPITISFNCSIGSFSLMFSMTKKTVSN